MFSGNGNGDDNSHVDYNDEMTEANDNNEHTMIESYCNNNNDNNKDNNYDINDVYDNTEYCTSDTPFYIGLYWPVSGVDISTLCMIEGACNNCTLEYDDVVDSIKVNDDVIHCTKVDNASNGCRNIFIKQGTYSNNNNIDNNHYNKSCACNNTRNGNHTYDNYIGNNAANNATPYVPIHYMIVSVLFVAPFIYCNMQYRVKKRAKGGVKGINIMIIIVYIILLLLQGIMYCFSKLYASTRILYQTCNNSNNNQCNNNNNNNTIGLLMLYTNMKMIFGLYCVTQSVSLSSVRLLNVHTMTTVEMLALSMLKLFDECSKRIHVMKLSIMTELDLSVNTRKLGVRDIEYRKRIWY